MTTPQSRAKRRGAQFEMDRVQWHRDQGRDAERLRTAGSLDEGDVVVKHEGRVWIEECKAPGPGSPLNLPSWWDEAVTEAANYAKRRGLDPAGVTPVLVVKRRMRGAGDAWIVQPSPSFYG